MVGNSTRIKMGIALTLASLLVSIGLSSATLAKQKCQRNICISTKRIGKTVEFFAENRKSALPITLAMSVDMQNMHLANGTTGPHVLRAGQRKYLFTLRRTRNAKWRYNYRYRWTQGDYRARHDTRHVYRLPFKRGSRYRVSQSCNGHSTHKGSSQYAIDFAMPDGTPVYAARAGRVVAVKGDSTKNGFAKAFAMHGNYITIEHQDRTLGRYFHLRRGGLARRLNEYVSAGDLIGYSGNTGFSSGPHLHFIVTVASQDAHGTRSLPVTFETQHGPLTCPKRSLLLTAR